jgi:hypothetical protein
MFLERSRASLEEAAILYLTEGFYAEIKENIPGITECK